MHAHCFLLRPAEENASPPNNTICGTYMEYIFKGTWLFQCCSTFKRGGFLTPVPSGLGNGCGGGQRGVIEGVLNAVRATAHAASHLGNIGGGKSE